MFRSRKIAAVHKRFWNESRIAVRQMHSAVRNFSVSLREHSSHYDRVRGRMILFTKAQRREAVMSRPESSSLPRQR